MEISDTVLWGIIGLIAVVISFSFFYRNMKEQDRNREGEAFVSLSFNEEAVLFVRELEKFTESGKYENQKEAALRLFSFLLPVNEAKGIVYRAGDAVEELLQKLKDGPDASFINRKEDFEKYINEDRIFHYFLENEFLDDGCIGFAPIVKGYDTSELFTNKKIAKLIKRLNYNDLDIRSHHFMKSVDTFKEYVEEYLPYLQTKGYRFIILKDYMDEETLLYTVISEKKYGKLCELFKETGYEETTL